MAMNGRDTRRTSRVGTSVSPTVFLLTLLLSRSCTVYGNLRIPIPPAFAIAGATTNDGNKKTLILPEIRAISFDVTGTLVATKEPVIQSYHDALLWSKFPNPPTREEMKVAFKTAYKERCIESPCFGGSRGVVDSDVQRGAGRDWWRATVERVLLHSGRSPISDFLEEDFNRYFRRVYQHFGSPAGYMVLDDARALLDSLQKRGDTEPDQAPLLLGITSNTPTRHMESVLPMLGIHDSFQWFTCSQEVGAEKPSSEIFEDAYQQAKFWIPDLEKHEVLHIGDSLACDFCGAKAFGFQALLLDRSDNPAVTAYQDWIEAPDYPGKNEEDIQCGTITNLLQVLERIGMV